jgi:hypothetical protein
MSKMFSKEMNLEPSFLVVFVKRRSISVVERLMEILRWKNFLKPIEADSLSTTTDGWIDRVS